MRQKQALIVHPDKTFCNRIKRLLRGVNCRAEVGSKLTDADSAPDLTGYDLVVTEDAPEGSTTQTISLPEQALKAKIPVILFADQGDVRNAVKAIQNGVFDYFTKNSDDSVIQAALDRVIKPQAKEHTSSHSISSSQGNRSIIASAPSMQQLLETAQRVARSNATVLIQGESGTGKEVLARFIHRQSERFGKPFVAMNCAALPENLAESELFGYEKGAFTGATQHRSGKFEQSQGGTLLLDEISEMPLSLQVKLLRVLQEKEVDHIGGHKPIPVDVRVIATSNKDLASMVKNGKFRDDLYFRLRVIAFKIPPLRERKEDIPLLAKFFAKKYGAMHQNGDVRFATQALAQLANWPWPGNVRELENTIERSVLISQVPLIGSENLLLDHDLTAMDNSDHHVRVGITVKEMEKKLISETLQQVNDNRTHAAKILGISIRTLRNKLREYDEAGLTV